MKKVEIPKWLEGLPLAPEFRPTDTEFADPIAYISKIEKEASAFGICKIIPPVPRPSRKYVLHNLNQSLSRNPELGSDVNLVTPSKSGNVVEENCGRNADNWESRAVFTTRHQELGCEKGKKVKGVTRDQVLGAKKQVWQSGEVYSLEQFEAKAKNFSRSQLGTVKDVNPLVVEAMFWKAASEKPIYVEYANDVPGSGFSEPEGLLHYFHKRRRRRKRNSFDRNNLSSSCSKNVKLETVSSSFRDDKDSGSQNNPNLCTETASSSLPSDQSHQSATFPARKDSNSSNEMEGTAGWKLSNSPWNLQVIARSPGSLTRFMPDDIPGVTSPMVYIGMLFSWFAWHVEDHELHSLNFLHMGSPKTWYAVPGDYAFNFEETIRLRAFGGNTDQLVALSLLGEKTTVLPPEVFVASGIPCCRLVQNPGEFVVTFPRAYHIGFSHGFNCGEAANFGTPKWLTVAKEAAVRRAAMNQLPMLSHQQLLYLLTMSFISRIPRSLIPGVRSSRLRDRQKEERELLVKRAFIEDILYENNLTSLLLQSNPSFHMVLWDVESLPSSSKKSELCKDMNTIILTEKDHSENDGNMDHTDKLSKYIGAVGFDLNDDDLAYDFQMDSGALPCVACGILGFPFMTVIQPSEAASINLLLENPGAVPMESHLLVEPTHVAEGPIEDALDKAKSNGKELCHLNEAYLVPKSSQPTCSAMEQSLVPDHSSLKNKAGVAEVETANRWNVSNLFLKPRIFCLEHAIQVEEFLRSKGGSNVLVICHSDFQKIKAHAAVVAEEIAAPFNYIEIPPSNASQENLNLIEIAIDSEEQTDCVDWTSKLSINLQHYVKVKRTSSSKNLQYLLNLGGFFGDGTPISNASSVKWSSRKLRSKRHLKLLLQGKPSVGIDIIGKGSGSSLGHKVASKDSKIIQYSRKKFKSHCSSRTKAPANRNNLGIDPLAPSSLASDGKSKLQHEVSKHLSSTGCVKNSSPPLHADPFIASTPTIENVESQTGICQTNKTAAEEKVDNSWHDGSMKKNEKPCSESLGLPFYENGRGRTGEAKISIEEDKTDECVVASETCVKLGENDFGMLRSDADTGTKEASGPSNYLDYEPSPVYKEQTVEVTEISKSSIASGQQQLILSEGNSEDKVVSSSIALSNESTSDLIEDIASEKHLATGSCNDGKSFLTKNRESDDQTSSMKKTDSIEKSGHKRKRDAGLQTEDQLHVGSFIKSPCEGLRPRGRKDTSSVGGTGKEPAEETVAVKRSRTASAHLGPRKDKKREQKGRFKCDLDGCSMSFQSRAELVLHKGNRCPVEGCRRKFSSHRYATQHQRVHDDDRPLKCPWDGCKMSFKWAWARTEHLRVHTGEKPYVCKVKGCGLTFRFVSDFSRHRRKKGHYVKTPT